MERDGIRRRWPAVSLRTQLLLTFLLVAGIPMVGYAVTTEWSLRQRIVQREAESLDVLRESSRLLVDHLASGLQAIEEGRATGPTGWALAELAADDPRWQVFDRDEIRRHGLPRLALWSADGEQQLLFASRVGPPPGRVRGWELNSARFLRQVWQIAAIGEREEAYLLSGRGALVLRSDGQPLAAGDDQHDPILRLARRQESGALADYYSPLTGDRRMGVFTTVPNTPWRLVLTFSREPLFAEIRESALLARSFTLFTLLLATLAAIWLSRQFSRSLSHVAHQVRQLGSGHFEPPASEPLISEYRALVATVHEVSGELRQAFDQTEQVRAALEDEVHSRTRALEEKVRELQQANEQLERMQEQLIQSARQAAMGQMAAMVAHEVRNRFNVILPGIRWLQLQLGDRMPADLARLAHDIAGEAERGTQLMSDLVRAARPTHPSTAAVDVTQLADDVVRLAAGPKVTAVLDCADGLRVSGDAGQLKQVLTNLVLNAVQAMPDGGTLTIRSREQAGTAVVDVEDTGPGIPPEHLPRLFEPFFTTKPEGTGLGLGICQLIIEQHGGHIDVASRPGRTRFRLVLPLAASPSPDRQLENA